jgi:hypothetical protein
MKLNRVEERLIDEFMRRYESNKQKQPFDNSSLVAGSPMYYYCKACGAFITALPETHFTPAPRYCDDCERLKTEALLDEALRRVKA